jgi:hypothetical protein
VTDREMDNLFTNAADAVPDIDPALLARLRDSIQPTMQPVRPLPQTWALVSGFAAICALVAVAGAARAGFYGFEDLGVPARVLIFSVLGVLVWVMGSAFAGEMIPGNRQVALPGILLAGSSAALLLVFAVFFRDYHTSRFIPAGIVCLATGLLHAAPAGLLAWLLLRRGFAVSPAAAGLVGGALAGMAGIGMLELHCNNFQALHVLVWHTAVVPASAFAGALLGRVLHRNRRDA